MPRSRTSSVLLVRLCALDHGSPVASLVPLGIPCGVFCSLCPAGPLLCSFGLCIFLALSWLGCGVTSLGVGCSLSVGNFCDRFWTFGWDRPFWSFLVLVRCLLGYVFPFSFMSVLGIIPDWSGSFSVFFLSFSYTFLSLWHGGMRGWILRYSFLGCLVFLGVFLGRPTARVFSCPYRFGWKQPYKRNAYRKNDV